MKYKYSKEELKNVVSCSASVAQVCKKLGLA